jgi:hypothetical protein
MALLLQPLLSVLMVIIVRLERLTFLQDLLNQATLFL